jgi:hypothetical protein
MKIDDFEGDQLDDWATAIHEAAHAIMTAHFRFPLGSISVESDGTSAGTTVTPESGEFMTLHPDRFFALEKEIVILMAGAEAVKIILPELSAPPGNNDDRVQIAVRLEDLCLHRQEETETAERRLRNVTEWYVGESVCRCAIIDLADELANKGTTSKEEAKRLTSTLLEKYHAEDYPGAAKTFRNGTPPSSKCASRSKTEINDCDPPRCGRVKMEMRGFVTPAELTTVAVVRLTEESAGESHRTTLLKRGRAS